MSIEIKVLRVLLTDSVTVSKEVVGVLRCDVEEFLGLVQIRTLRLGEFAVVESLNGDGVPNVPTLGCW